MKKWDKMAKALGAKLGPDDEVEIDMVDQAGEADVEGASIKENAERRKGNLKKGYPYRDPNMEISDALPEAVKKVMKRTPMIAAADENGELKTNYIRIKSKRLRKLNSIVGKGIRGETKIVEEDISRPEVNNENAKNRFRESKAVQEIGESGRKRDR
jgi:hypothetical protein